MPMKTFKVREQHKFGLSEKTKNMTKERVRARLEIKSKSQAEKLVQHQKYKRLRNRVNSLIKEDTIKDNDSWIEKAKDENEMCLLTYLLKKR